MTVTTEPSRRRSATSSPRWPPTRPPTPGRTSRPSRRRACSRPRRWSATPGAGLRARRHRRRRRAGLCRSAIGPTGRGRRAGCGAGRSGTSPLHVHRRAVVVGRGTRRDDVAVHPSDAHRLPVALAAGTPRRHATAATCARCSVRLIHELVSNPGATEGQMLAELERVWAELPFESQWHSANELERHRAMVSTFAQWHAQTRHELTEAGSEVDVDGVLSSRRRRAGRARARTGGPAGTRRGGQVGGGRPQDRARVPSARTTRNATRSWPCTSWRSRRGSCRTATNPVAAGWSTSARPVLRAPPNGPRTR